MKLDLSEVENMINQFSEKIRDKHTRITLLEKNAKSNTEKQKLNSLTKNKDLLNKTIGILSSNDIAQKALDRGNRHYAGKMVKE